MSFILKAVSVATLVCACVSCVVCSVNWGMYINNIYIKKTGETNTTKAEMGIAIAFTCLVFWELIGHFLTKKLSG